MTDPQQPGFGGPQQPGFGAPMSKKDAKAQAAAAKAYSKSQRSWFAKHKILTALGAFILLAVIITVASGGGGGTDTVNTADDNAVTETEAPAAKAPASKAAPKPAAPAMMASSKEMIALLEANALKARNTYKGKRVTVSGFVGNIDASGDYFSLLPEADAIVFTGIQVYTSDKFQDQVANFSKGQAITVTGKINDVGELIGYSLKAETIK